MALHTKLGKTTAITQCKFRKIKNKVQENISPIFSYSQTPRRIKKLTFQVISHTYYLSWLLSFWSWSDCPTWLFVWPRAVYWLLWRMVSRLFQILNILPKITAWTFLLLSEMTPLTSLEFLEMTPSILEPFYSLSLLALGQQPTCHYNGLGIRSHTRQNWPSKGHLKLSSILIYISFQMGLP